MDYADDAGKDVAIMVSTENYVTAAKFGNARTAAFTAWTQVCMLNQHYYLRTQFTSKHLVQGGTSFYSVPNEQGSISSVLIVIV